MISALSESIRPRSIAELRTDGGTAFCLDVIVDTRHGQPGSLRPEFAAMVEFLRRERSPEVEAYERREGIVLELPMPGRGGRGQHELGFASSRQDDPWRHQWGPEVPPPIARITVEGRHGQNLTFYLEDRCHCRLDERIDPDTGEMTWRCRLEAKARELYADGLDVWIERWLGLWSWLMTGHWASPRTGELVSLGWRTTQWHVNCDFVDFNLDSRDVRQFVRMKRFSDHGRQRDEMEWLGTEAAGSDACPWVETLTIGRKTSDTQIVIYRKGEQLRSAKRVEPRASMYAALWEVNGWDPDLDGDPTRVELRFRKKGLQQRQPSRELDFRDPDLLLDEDAVQTVWGGVTDRRRLVLPTSSRKERCKMDPRWAAVQSVGTLAPDLRQVPRRVRELTREERMAKDLRDVALAAVRYASRHGTAVTSWGEVADVLGAVSPVLRAGVPSVLRALPRAPDLVQASKRAAVSSQFFEEQARAAFEEFASKLDAARGESLQRRSVFDLASGR